MSEKPTSTRKKTLRAKKDKVTETEMKGKTQEIVCEPKKPTRKQKTKNIQPEESSPKKQARKNKRDVPAKEKKSSNLKNTTHIKIVQNNEKVDEKGKGRVKVNPKSSQPITSIEVSSSDEEATTKKEYKPKASVEIPSSSSEEKGAKPCDGSILQLKIVLLGSNFGNNPLITRTIQVLNTDTFFQLRRYVNSSLGFVLRPNTFWIYGPQTKTRIPIADLNKDFDYLNNPDVLNQQETKLSHFLTAKNDSVMYEYRIVIEPYLYVHISVESILPPPEPRARYPQYIGEKRALTPDEIHEVKEFNHMVNVLSLHNLYSAN